MKKFTHCLLIAGIFIIFPILSFSQNPPHPNGGSGPGSGNTPVGGGAPLGEGIVIMLVLGVSYASKKVYNGRKKISSLPIN